MMINILILLVIVTAIAVIVSIAGSSKEAPGEEKIILVDNHKADTTERLENSLGTLSDRAVAALQYKRMEDSFMKNGGDQVRNQVRRSFENMAKQLATIGTNVKPEDVQTTTKDGLPPGWALDK